MVSVTFGSIAVCLLLDATWPGETQRPLGGAAPVEIRGDLSAKYPANAPLTAIAEDDPCLPVVQAELDRISENYAQSGILDADMSMFPPREILGRALPRLLPGYRFFLIRWVEKVHDPLPPGVERPMGLMVPHLVLAIDRQKQVTLLKTYDGGGDFAELLINGAVKVRNEDDARLLWRAYREIRRQSTEGRIEHPSERVWRLGVEPVKNRPAIRFYEIRLKADFTVESASYQSEER